MLLTNNAAGLTSDSCNKVYRKLYRDCVSGTLSLAFVLFMREDSLLKALLHKYPGVLPDQALI